MSITPTGIETELGANENGTESDAIGVQVQAAVAVHFVAAPPRGGGAAAAAFDGTGKVPKKP